MYLIILGFPHASTKDYVYRGFFIPKGLTRRRIESWVLVDGLHDRFNYDYELMVCTRSWLT